MASGSDTLACSSERAWWIALSDAWTAPTASHDATAAAIAADGIFIFIPLSPFGCFDFYRNGSETRLFRGPDLSIGKKVLWEEQRQAWPVPRVPATRTNPGLPAPAHGRDYPR